MFKKQFFLFSFILLLWPVNNISFAIWNAEADLYQDNVINWLDVEVMGTDWLEGDSYSEAEEPDPAGLLAHYTFDDGTAVNSGSVGAAADGVLYNGANIEYDGVRGNNVLVLNGGLGYGDEQYVDVGGGGGGTWADITGDMTVAAWIKPDLGNTTTNFMTIVSKGDGENGDNGFSLGRYGTTNNVSFVLNYTPWNGLAASPADGWDGQWHHVAGTYTASGVGAGVRIYVDGVERGYLSRSGALLTNTWDVIIGGNAEAIFEGSGYRHWDGSLDDVRIYERALSQTEVAVLFGGGQLYVPLDSPANIYDSEPQGSKVVNFRDYAFLADSWLAVAPEPVNECDNWQALHPEWIFCDDFEDGTALVRDGRYFSYNSAGGGFALADSVGVGGSKGMRAIFEPGKSEFGNLHLAFGRVPYSVFDKGIRNTEDFSEIYYRMYVRTQEGWQGGTLGKLSRAFIFAGANGATYSQAMIGHLWGSGERLSIDPVSLVDENCVCLSTGYNDFGHMDWLGNVTGVTPLFAAENCGLWYCIEAHVKLNDSDPEIANGLQEYWIDGQLEARNDGLNFVKCWDDYGINAIYFENYSNSGSPVVQERYFDNIVVSTQPIGSYQQ